MWQAFEGVVKGGGGNQDARGKIADKVSFPSSSRGHRVHAHLSYSSFSYPFKLLPHSSAHLLQVMHCVVFRFYWLKVRSLAESHNWLELDKFSKARKSLIGYEVSLLTMFSEIIRQCTQLGTDTCKVNPLNPKIRTHLRR